MSASSYGRFRDSYSLYIDMSLDLDLDLSLYCAEVNNYMSQIPTELLKKIYKV